MELTDFDRKCFGLLEAMPGCHSKHCFRSAIRHLELGEKLYPVDRSMGVFRYITAEEEAATGLIRCLQENGYENASELKPNRHPHKHAVIPFFSILAQFVEDRFRQFGITIDLFFDDRQDPHAVRLQVQMAEVTLIPDPPLNFTFLHEGKRFSYRPQIDAYAAKHGVKAITKHIDKSANLRNLLLYAAPQGMPSPVEVEDKFFTAYQNKVLAMLRTYLMIAPYKERLPFVQDSLDAILNMLGTLKLDHIHDEL
jgi:hypothetical protein